jgi:mannitol repressor
MKGYVMDKGMKWLADYNQVVSIYHNESDRAAAVLATSYLERILEEHIRESLIDDPFIDELFIGYGPLSSFSAKISVAYGFGLIPKWMKQDMTYIRKIRNHFAHHHFEVSFMSSPARDLCANLSMAKPILDSEGATNKEREPRFQFLLTVGMNIVWISDTQLRKKETTEQTMPLKEKNDEG